jgi:hypothetical protein
MVIVAGHITVEPQQRESYLTGWVSIAEQARREPGCLDCAISADLLDPGPHQQLRALGVASGPRDLPHQRPMRNGAERCSRWRFRSTSLTWGPCSENASNERLVR